MKPMPPLKALIPFHAVARHLSFSRAAEELCVSHSAISQRVKHLEDFLDKKLFHRNKNKILLTENGEQYFQQIDDALSIIQTATKKLLSESNKNAITINMLSSFAMRWLIPRVQNFQRKFPNYELRLCSEWRNIDFEKEDIDIALYYGDGNWPSLKSELIFKEDIAILASPTLIPKKNKITIDKLLGEFKFCYVQALLREDNFTLWFGETDYPEPEESSRIYFQNTLQALQAAIHGAGIVAANIHFLKDEIEEGSLVKIVTETVETGNAFYLVHPDESHIKEKVQVFKEWLLSEAKS